MLNVAPDLVRAEEKKCHYLFSGNLPLSLQITYLKIMSFFNLISNCFKSDSSSTDVNKLTFDQGKKLVADYNERHGENFALVELEDEFALLLDEKRIGSFPKNDLQRWSLNHSLSNAGKKPFAVRPLPF